MSAKNTPTSYVRRSTVLFAAAAFTLGLVIPYRLALGHPQQQRPQGFPDLVGGLKAVPGCLGVETARTASGKNVIFAWFEDKKAVLNWYYSDTHQHAMRMLVGRSEEHTSELQSRLHLVCRLLLEKKKKKKNDQKMQLMTVLTL